MENIVPCEIHTNVLTKKERLAIRHERKAQQHKQQNKLESSTKIFPLQVKHFNSSGKKTYLQSELSEINKVDDTQRDHECQQCKMKDLELLEHSQLIENLKTIYNELDKNSTFGHREEKVVSTRELLAIVNERDQLLEAVERLKKEKEALAVELAETKGLLQDCRECLEEIEKNDTAIENKASEKVLQLEAHIDDLKSQLVMSKFDSSILQATIARSDEMEIALETLMKENEQLREFTEEKISPQPSLPESPTP